MNIKKYRLRRGISATRMATLLNVGRKTYFNYENERTDPSLRTFAQICKILEISADEALETNDGTSTLAEPTTDENEILKEAVKIIEHYSQKKSK